ncbi:MAG TPA: hypothetical protein DEB09_00965 [Candidatus Magasanikbacteria bacterium]|nr:hypothetical protein [Candidatus Magasanikbacteria bacterium]
MKHIRRIFSVAMITCVVFLEIAPALPAYAFTNPVVANKEEVKLDNPVENIQSNETEKLIDWSQTDWDSEVVLLSDMNVYKQKMEAIAKGNNNEEAKNIQPKKVKMNIDEAMEYFNVPNDVRETVRQYRDSVGMFAKKNVASKDFLQSYIQSLLPIESLAITKAEDNLGENFVDIRTATKLNIKNNKAEDNTIKPVEFTITNREFKVEKHSLQKVTIKGIAEKVKQRGLPGEKINKKDVGLFKKINNFVSDLFKIETVDAEVATDLIAYYNGIENNTLDNALYYISRSQTEGGSFAQVATYEETAETALALSSVGRTGSTQFNDALNYLINTEPQNTREKAIKARLMEGLGQPYQTYLDEFIANENSDHGYGLDVGYESDILTTMEGALAMYSANYSIQDKLPLALYYVLNHIPADGALKYENNGPVSYYLINKIVQYLQPFKAMTVANDQGVNISVQSKIDALLGYLSSQYDDENEKLLGTTDVIDEVMTLQTWKTYNVEQSRQKVLESKLIQNQYVDGSFGNSLRATAYSLQTLDKPDLVLTNLQSTGALESRVASPFTLSISNQGYAASSNTIIYVFADNVYTGLSLNLGGAGITIEPNESVNINFTIPTSVTNKFTGVMDLKFYIEPSEDINFDNNWFYSTFTFSSASDGTPALPMYYVAMKHEISSVANLNIRWQVKADALRLNYVVMWREKGTTEWNYQGISNTWNGAFLGGAFEEGKTYEITAGVLHQNGTSVTYFNQLTDVKMSGVNNLYLGGVTGTVTVDNAPSTEQIGLSGYNVNGKTDTSGNYTQSGLENGITAGWPSTDQYEKFVSKFAVPVGATTTGVRFFTHLKPDTQAPVLTQTELRYASNYVVKTGLEYTLLSWGSDNISIKSGDFYLWNPTENYWSYIGTGKRTNSTYVELKWTVPQDLPLSTGYKIKGVLYDYRGNVSNESEWGPFEIIDGTPPTLTLYSPNGGEKFLSDTTTTITWSTQSVNPINTVKLYIYYPTTNRYISNSVPNTGSYDWKIPISSSYLGDKLKVRVYGTDPVNLQSNYDESDDYFSILDGSPNLSEPWSNPIKLTTSTETNISSRFVNPVVNKYDSQGNLHLIYLYNKDVYNNGQRIITDQLYYRTKNTTGVWSDPQLVYNRDFVTDNNATGYQPLNDFTSSFDSLNHLHLAWQYGSYGGCDSFNAQEIGYMYFDGTIWSGPQNISNNSSTSQSPSLTVNGNNVYVAWMDGRSWDVDCSVTGTAKINLINKNVSGGSWSNAELLSPDQYTSYPKLMTTKDGKLHLVYSAGGQDKVQHIYKVGSSWSQPIDVVSDSVDYPDLTTGPTNTLHFVSRQNFQDPITSQYRSRIIYNYYNGINWSTTTEVSPILENFSADYPKIAVDENDKPQIIFQHYNQTDNKKKIVWITQTNSGNWLSPVGVSYDSQYPSESLMLVATSRNKVSVVYSAYYSFLPEIYYNEADLGINYLAPQPTTNFVGQSATNSIRLSWDKYSNVDNDFDHFSLRRTSSTGALLEEYEEVASLNDVNAVEYFDQSATNDIDYYYVMAVYDNGGKVAYTYFGPVKPNMVYPEIAVKLDGVDIVNSSTYNFGEWQTGIDKTAQIIVENNSEVNLNLNPYFVSGGSDCALGYDNNPIVIPPFTSASYTMKMYGLEDGNKLCVLAFENNDQDENPFVINFVGSPILPPAISGFTGQSATNSVYLSWDKYSNVGNDFDHFEIWSGTLPVGQGDYGMIISITDVNQNSYLDNSNSLYLGDRYYVVRVHDAAGHITASENIGPVRINSAQPRMEVVLGGANVDTETNYNFGSLRIGQEGTVSLKLVNDGNSELIIQPFEISDSSLCSVAYTPEMLNIQPGSSSTFNLKYNPTNTTSIACSISIHHNVNIETENPFVINLSAVVLPLVQNVITLPLNEVQGSSIFNDTSGFNQKATCSTVSSTCPLAGLTGVNGTAIKFDGLKNMLLTPDSAYTDITEQITLEAWIKPEVNSNYTSGMQTIVSKGTNYELDLYNSGVLRGGITNKTGQRITVNSPTNAVKMNDWNHVAMTYDGQLIKLYVNGIKVAEKVQTGLISLNNYEVTIGNLRKDLAIYYQGVMDQVKIYKTALTPTEVLTNYQEYPKP